MEELPPGWKISQRDDERHRLEWSKKNPEKAKQEKEILKQKLKKLHKNSDINLKEKYPYLF